MLLDDGLGDGEAEADAYAVVVDAREALEDPLLLIARHADAVVVNAELDPLGMRLHADLHRRSFRRIADRVGDEVGQDLLDPVAVREGRGRFRPLYRKLASLRNQLQSRHDVARDRRHVHLHRVQRQ